MSIEEQRLQKVLSHVAVQCCMKDWEYETEQQSESIENYFGFLIPLKVVGVFENKECVQHVFVKLPPLEESIRAFSGYMWDTEAYVYNSLVPMWKRLSKLNLDELIPRCYYADSTPNNQILVLKDMRYDGYMKYNEAFLDIEHVIVSLRCLAQFHALSLISKKDLKGLTSTALRPYTHIYPRDLNETLQNSFRRHSQLFTGSKYERYWKETLVNYKTVATEDTLQAKCLVYGHGDYWKGNIIYKYENNVPVKACTFDFQTCRVMSPAHDFLFFILNSTRGSLRRLHYNDFLNEYYDCLNSTLFDHDIQLDLLYTKEDFISDLKRVSSFCLVRICMSFSLWLGFESDTLVKSKTTWDNDKQWDENLCLLKDLLVDIMDNLHTYGYISL